MGTPWLEELEIRQLLTGTGRAMSNFLPQAASVSQQSLAAPSSLRAAPGDYVNPAGGIHTPETGAHANWAQTRDSHDSWNETAGPNLHWQAAEGSGVGDASNRDGGRGEAGPYTTCIAESPDRETANPLRSSPLSDDSQTSVSRVVEALFAERDSTIHPGSLVSQGSPSAVRALAAVQLPGLPLARSSVYVSASDLSHPHPSLPMELINLPQGGTQQAQETPFPGWPGIADVLRSFPYGNRGILEAGIREFLGNLAQVGNQFWAQEDDCRLTVWLIAGAAAAAACEMARRQLRRPEIEPTEWNQPLGSPAEEDVRDRS